MAKKVIKAQMAQRRDTKANWAAQNPVLLAGELGIVSDDPNLYKVGDGATAWNALPFRGFDGTVVQETGTSTTAVMSQKAVSNIKAKIGSDTLSINGSYTDTMPETNSGWHYYPFPILKSGITYNVTVRISEMSTSPVYWHVRSEDVKVINDRAITAGNLADTYSAVLSNEYDDLELAIYSGAAVPKLTIEVTSSTSDIGRAFDYLSKNNDNMIMASSRYFFADDLLYEKTTYPQVLNGQKKGVITGVKISIYKAGTLVLTHGKALDGNTPTFTDLQTFDVTEGINYLYFDAPVTLTDNEGIAIDPASTAYYHRAPSGTTDIGSRYFTGTSWGTLVNGVVMAIFTVDLTTLAETIAALEKKVEEQPGKEEGSPSISNGALAENIAPGDHYATILGSARFGKVTAEEKGTAYSFVDGQPALVGKVIVGVKISISQEGTIVLVKCSGFRQPSPTFTELQTFNVVKGINYLYLDTPIILSNNEAIGLSPSATAYYHRGGYDSAFNKGYYYYTGTAWNYSGADLVMAILADECPDESERLTMVEDSTIFSSVYPITPMAGYGHLFVDKIYTRSSPTIPCQSLFDVAVTAALGFKMIEVNVVKTSDGVYVTGHQVGSNILESLTDLDGNSIAVNVGELTFEQLRANYRYKSSYAQFRSPVTSLEEFLLACRQYDLTPFVTCFEKGIIDLTESIVGTRYVAYGGSRLYTNATLAEYQSSGMTKDQLVARCKAVGYPFILGVGSAILDPMTDDEIVELVKGVHEQKCWINWAACYHTPSSNLRLKRLGLDSYASGWDVPFFNEYDIRKSANIFKGFNEFTGYIAVGDDSATMTDDQSISAYIERMSIIAKGQLHIHFKGSINVQFGKINDTIVSDGNSSICLSSIIEDANATITLTSVGESKIYSLDYKVVSVF